MPIPKEDEKSPGEQYNIILLSHIVMYWIGSMLDLDERLLVTGFLHQSLAHNIVVAFVIECNITWVAFG